MVDLTMLNLHNSKERSLDDFIKLSKEADPRLKYVGVQQPAGSFFSFIEILFDE